VKKIFHKMATYTALILVSSLPLSVDALEDLEKKSSSVTSLINADKTPSTSKRKLATQKSQ
jgi:hypothetical protein